MWHKLCHIRAGDDRDKGKVRGVIGVPRGGCSQVSVPCPGLAEEL